MCLKILIIYNTIIYQLFVQKNVIFCFLPSKYARVRVLQDLQYFTSIHQLQSEIPLKPEVQKRLLRNNDFSNVRTSRHFNIKTLNVIVFITAIRKRYIVFLQIVCKLLRYTQKNKYSIHCLYDIWNSERIKRNCFYQIAAILSPDANYVYAIIVDNKYPRNFVICILLKDFTNCVAKILHSHTVMPA